MLSAAAAVGLLACIAFSSPTSAATFTLAELAAGQTFRIGSVEFVDWVFENPTIDLNVVTVDTIDDVNLPGFQINGNGELSIELELEYTFTVRTTNDEPLIRGALLKITEYAAAPESEINVNLEGQNNFAGLKLETFVNDRDGKTVLIDGQGVEPPVASLPLRSKVILDITGFDPAVISLDTYTTQFAVGTPQTQTLTVNKAGEGSGTVTSAPSGIDCGDLCSADFDFMTILSLTATPDAGFQVTSWSGCDFQPQNNINKCAVLMTEEKTVTANFGKFKLTNVSFLPGVYLLLLLDD
jgi:hypothetical protein